MQNCSFFSLFQYFKGRLRGEAANPHLIAFSLSPYSLQQQCCGFYVVRPKGGVAIVVIVALAGLVVLGGEGTAVYFIEKD